MENIQKHGFIVSSILTGAIWIVLTILCFALKIQPPHSDYKEIKIQLANPTPVAKSVAPKESEATKTKVPKKEEKSSVQKTDPVKKTEAVAKEKSSAKKNVSKETVAKEAAKTSTPEKQVLQKSVDELMAENNSTKKKTTTWDDSLFDDSDDFVETTSTSSNTNAKPSSSSSSFEGTAASGSSKSSSSKSTSSSSNANSNYDETSSSSTSSALSKITSATYTGTSTAGVTSSTSIQSGSKNGRIAIQMSDGSARELLSPSKPVIAISKQNAALIDSTRKVTISFKVLAGGTVPLSYIEIKPASLLPLEIQNEIKSQVSTWRFASDSFDGQATFDYSIIKE